jgi:hypothetical protein
MSPETNPAGGPEVQPGSLVDYVEYIAERARTSVETYETRNFRKEGCLNGIQMCEDMKNLQVEDFELALIVMEQKDKELRQKYHNGEVLIENYRQQRCATAQVEWFYERLRVAHADLYGELPDNQRRALSATAMLDYQTYKLSRSLKPEFLN